MRKQDIVIKAKLTLPKDDNYDKMHLEFLSKTFEWIYPTNKLDNIWRLFHCKKRITA